MEEYPHLLTVQTCNICNADCIFCGYQFMKMPKQVIDDILFKKSIDEFAAMGSKSVLLSGAVGEPLLDLKIVERIQYCRFKQFKKIKMVTNCLNLHNIGAENFLKSGITDIYLSMTGFDFQMHKRIYRSKHFDQMKQNILALLRLNHALGKPVNIIVCLRIDKPVQDILNQPGFSEVSSLAESVSYNYYFDNWSGRIRKEDLTGNMKLRPQRLLFFKRISPCSLLYDRVAILVNGDIALCGCRELDGDSELVIGNIKDMSLERAYRSDRFQQIKRKWISSKQIPKICLDCSNYSPKEFLMLSENVRQFERNIDSF